MTTPTDIPALLARAKAVMAIKGVPASVAERAKERMDLLRLASDLAAALEKVQAERNAALELISSLEWGINGKCPLCFGWAMPEGEMRGRHSKNCKLKAMLTKQEDKA